MGADPAGHPLLGAFHFLLHAAPLDRQDLVLRTAMRQLLEVDQHRGQPAADPPRLRPRPPKDEDAWGQVKAELRGAMEARHVGVAQLAGALGVSSSMAGKLTAPKGSPPSVEIIGKVQAWIASDIGAAIAPPAKPLSRDAVSAAHDPPARPAAKVSGNGHARAGALPATRLSVAEREALVAVLDHDPGRLREVASRDLCDRLAAGGTAPPEVVQRLAAALGEDAR
jgi:hypothetical protein